MLQSKNRKQLTQECRDTADHRRRIELEDKAKVVPSVWGTEFVQFLAGLADMTRSIRKGNT